MNYKLLITSFLLFLVSAIDFTLKAQESKIVDCITQHPLNFDEKENELPKEGFDHEGVKYTYDIENLVLISF